MRNLYVTHKVDDVVLVHYVFYIRGPLTVFHMQSQLIETNKTLGIFSLLGPHSFVVSVVGVNLFAPYVIPSRPLP